MKQSYSFSFSTQNVNTAPKDVGANREITLAEIITIIRSGSYPVEYEQLPELARRTYENNDTGAKENLNRIKRILPWFLASGYCPKGHNNETLQYNGVLQLDVDIKKPGGDQIAAALLKKVHELRPAGVLLAVISPSTYGIKILLATDNLNKSRHSEALQAAIEYLAQLLDIDPGLFDKVPASQPLYVPYLRNNGILYHNEDTAPLQIKFNLKAKEPERAQITYNEDTLLEAAQYLIDNKTDVANEYNGYLKILAACKNAFDENGLQIAEDLLANSAAYRQSNFSRQIRQKFKSLTRNGGNKATGATLVWLAQKNGFNPFYTRNTTILQANEDEYLTDVIQRCGINPLDVLGKTIVSPTGSGKTTFIAKFAKDNLSRRIILVLPQIAAIKQFCENNPTWKEFTGDIKGRLSIEKDERLLVTTIQSFRTLATRIHIEQYDVFFDEVHALTSDTSPDFKLKNLRLMNRIAQTARTFTGMTGTPLYNFDPAAADIPVLEVRQKTRVKKTVNFYDTKDILQTVVEMIKRSTAAGNLSAFLLNDKKLKMASVKAALKREGINAAFLNADNKNNPTFNSIVKDGTIPEGVQAIVTTTVLREGTNIYDERQVDFFIVGMHHSSTIQQITARFRKADKIDVHIIKSLKRDIKDYSGFNPAYLAKYYKEAAQRRCDEYNNQGEFKDATALLFEEHLRRNLQENAVFLNDDKKMQICYFHLNNLVYKSETAAEFSDNNLQGRNLAKYGFDIIGGKLAEYSNSLNIARTITAKCDPETSEAMKQGRKEKKEADKKAHQSVLDTLQAAVTPAAIIRQAEQNGSVPTAFKWVKELTQFYGVRMDAAINALRSIDTKSKYKQLVKRICAHRLQTDKDYLESGRLMAIQIKALEARIKVGNRYTADELRLKLVSVLALDKSINTETWQTQTDNPETVQTLNRRAVDILRWFFEVDAAGRPGGRACPRKRVFTINKINLFFVDTGFFIQLQPSPDFAQIERSIQLKEYAECPF